MPCTPPNAVLKKLLNITFRDKLRAIIYIKNKNNVIVYLKSMSQFKTGLTQAVIPSLVQRGIAAVSVGVNPGTSPPAVPSLFRWNFEGKEVMATWHPGMFFVVVKVF